MKRVQSLHRTETDGLIKVVAFERDPEAPIGSKEAEATSRVIYEGRDQREAREAENAASADMYAKPSEAPAVAAVKELLPFVKR